MFLRACARLKRYKRDHVVINFMKKELIDNSIQGADTSKLAQKRSFDDMNEWIDSTFQDSIVYTESLLNPYRNEIIEKWNNKVQAANGISLQKKFKVINTSIVSQIQGLDNDRDRLIKRTRLNRSHAEIIGKVTIFLNLSLISFSLKQKQYMPTTRMKSTTSI